MINYIKSIIKQLRQATRCSLLGFCAAWKYQLPFRLEIFVFLLACPVALYLGKSPLEKAILISSLLLVLIAEIINSAIETVVDRISLERNTLSGRAKDLACAAVFLTVINAIVVWGIIVL